MKQRVTKDQLTWVGTTRNWYLRNDTTTRRALGTAAQVGMNTMETMLLTTLMSLHDTWSCPGTIGGESGPFDASWHRIVMQTLRVLFDPAVLDRQNNPAEVELFVNTLTTLPYLYLNAINPLRRNAIATGAYRLAGQTRTEGDDNA